MTQPGQDPHCKDPAHLDVVLSKDAPQTVTATYMPVMACHNNEGYHSWGVVLSTKKKNPLNGLHLFPESVTWLPTQLKAVAATATGTQTIEIQHTDLKIFTKFAALSVAGVNQLIIDIAAAASHAPTT